MLVGELQFKSHIIKIHSSHEGRLDFVLSLQKNANKHDCLVAPSGHASRNSLKTFGMIILSAKYQTPCLLFGTWMRKIDLKPLVRPQINILASTYVYPVQAKSLVLFSATGQN